MSEFNQESYEVMAGKAKLVMSVEEYRKILSDYKTPGQIIKYRIEYLEALCRNIIRHELESYED